LTYPKNSSQLFVRWWPLQLVPQPPQITVPVGVPETVELIVTVMISGLPNAILVAATFSALGDRDRNGCPELLICCGDRG
jgi:hypothetical protein